ncbi:F-box/kelch-repeat protein [Nymphaea thermarum]|nr:F-box/kelch-repeat protein [Nymphaea thermarum]
MDELVASDNWEEPVIPDLPDDVALECLFRVPHSCLAAMRAVSRRWRKLVDGPDFSEERKLRGTADGFACLVQQHAAPAAGTLAEAAGTGRKSAASGRGPPVYGITLFDPRRGSWERLQYPDGHQGGLPLFCQCVSVAGKLVILGGWDCVTWEATRRVSVYDFRTRRWSKGKDMPGPARSFFAAAVAERTTSGGVGGSGGRGLVFVAGGHDENKNALRTGAVYDVGRDEWEELGEAMEEERDECEGLMVGKEFWVVSGYGTEGQGRFKESAEAFDTERGRWRRVDGAWAGGACPRSLCLGVADGDGGNSRVVSVDADGGNGAVKMGRCVVGMGGNWALVTGTAHEGAPVGCFLVDVGKHGGAWTRVEMPPEFSGFVQSGCFVEI